LPCFGIHSFFLGAQQIEQQRAERAIAQECCNPSIARTVPAAAAAMREYDDTDVAVGQLELAFEHSAGYGDPTNFR
jgi:hypothetical protein